MPIPPLTVAYPHLIVILTILLLTSCFFENTVEKTHKKILYLKKGRNGEEEQRKSRNKKRNAKDEQKPMNRRVVR